MPRGLRLALWLALLCFSVSCGAAAPRVAVTPPVAILEAAPELHPLGPPTPATDPIMELVALSDQHFQDGRQALALGHVDRARVEFDRALNLLLDSAYGGRTEPRLREQFDRLIDRISAHELRALAEGDGFTETQSEPASIDELLAMSATLSLDPSEADFASVAESGSMASGIDIPLNPRVLSYIELFQGRLHGFLEEGMRRGSRYLPMIHTVFRAEGLPLDLAYIPLVESAFKVNALSRARARGVWQFIRTTGLAHGLRQDWYIDERSDPEKATLAAARYLKTLHQMFDGDWHLAMASYNGGPGRVQRVMKRTGLSDFWRLAARRNALPRETREYVPMILAAIVIARDPARYGFDFTPDAPLTYDTIVLDQPADLRRIAEWAGTTIGEIQELNPELRRWTTPVRPEAYELRVPAGTHDLVRKRLAAAGSFELVTLRRHTVVRGESLSSIARDLRVARRDLAEANSLKTTARLQIGQQLIVPREPTLLMAARTDQHGGESGVTATPSAQVAASSERVKISYRVRRGDTLTSIARAYDTTVAWLQRWNGIAGSRITAGDRLTVYAPRTN